MCSGRSMGPVIRLGESPGQNIVAALSVGLAGAVSDEYPFLKHIAFATSWTVVLDFFVCSGVDRNVF